MGKFYILALLFCFYDATAQKHLLSIDHLQSGSFMPSTSFSDFAKRKGFKASPDSSPNAGLAFYRSAKDKSIQQTINRWENADTVFLSLHTTSEQEYLSWKEELVKQAYSSYTEKASSPTKSVAAFQKRNIIARISKTQDSTTTWYCLTLENKKLPPATSFQYAEDLLQLNSHEHIAAVFGAANVKKDLFYFSEHETNRCSVLFPNTSNQVIFIWDDEENNQDISFLMLGGLTVNANQSAIFNGNQFHKWRSRQGIYLGMSLRELQSVNGKSLDFYNWFTDQPGFVVPQNDGQLNLRTLGIQLQCLECTEDSSKDAPTILASETVLQAHDRVLVNSLILFPDKAALATK